MLIKCKCGAQFHIQPNHKGDWEIEMIGPWKFAHSCGWIVEIPNEDMRKAITNNLL